MLPHHKPRGHSNVYADETEPWKDLPTKACIPLSGGSRVDTCRPLPPLAIDKDEWLEIGRRMKWTRRTDKDLLAALKMLLAEVLEGKNGTLPSHASIAAAAAITKATAK